MYTDTVRESIYRKLGGHCTYCARPLSITAYGKPDWWLGAWEIDHGKPVSRGGTDDFSNLYAACVRCNREKGNMTIREFLRHRAIQEMLAELLEPPNPLVTVFVDPVMARRRGNVTWL